LRHGGTGGGTQQNRKSGQLQRLLHDNSLYSAVTRPKPSPH
jgi:hypothetical protein